MKKITTYLLMLVIFYVCLFSVLNFFNDKHALYSDTSYYIVVYGNKIELNGEPSGRLKARLDKGVYEFVKYGKKIIVSGGIGKEGFNEANIMKKYILDNSGIPQGSILVDNNGYDTYSTSINTFKAISELESEMNNVHIIGISQFYHIPRVKLSLKNAGFDEDLVFGISPDYYELRDFYSMLREIPAYIKYFLKEL